jgi:hypothetical protein
MSDENIKILTIATAFFRFFTVDERAIGFIKFIDTFLEKLMYTFRNQNRHEIYPYSSENIQSHKMFFSKEGTLNALSCHFASGSVS